TVNHRNTVTRPVNTFSLVDDEPRSLKNSTVVSSEPTPTTNITGLRINVRGLSLTKLSTTARRTISGSTSLVSRAIDELLSQKRSCSTIGPSARAGRKVRAATTMITPITSTTNKGVSVGNVPTDAATVRLRTSAPASANVGMIRKKRPTSMVTARVVFMYPVFAVRPANAD